MSRIKYLVFAFLLVSLAGCTAQKQEQAQTPPPPERQAAAQPATPEAAPATAAQTPAAQTAQAPAQQAKPAAGAQAGKPASAAAPPAAGSAMPKGVPANAVAPGAQPAVEPPKPALVLVPAGTRLEVRLDGALSSAENRDGDKFSTILDQDLTVDGKVVVPRGSTVSGKVISATQSGRVKGRANMALTLTEIKLKDAAYPVRTNTLSFEAEGSEKQDALKIGGGAGVGAIIGAIAGGKKGAAIGAAVGGGAGTATVLATKGKEVKFAAEDKFSFVLRDDLQIRLR